MIYRLKTTGQISFLLTPERNVRNSPKKINKKRKFDKNTGLCGTV